MSSTGLIGASIAIFVIAALLFFQANKQGIEPFQSTHPVAGRPYGAIGEQGDNNIPADLNKAPSAKPASATAVPNTATRPLTVPGPASAPRNAPATFNDLQELNERILTWLEAIDQLENEHPGSLTPDQKQQRVLFQVRSASLIDQIGSGMITDSASLVNQEIADMNRENSAFKTQFPSIEELNTFGTGVNPNAFLTAEQYTQFRALFDSGVNEISGYSQPDPLERVRLQQLQLFRQDIQTAEQQFGTPPIRMSAAKLFLKQLLKPDQPLPTLFSMEPNPAKQAPSFANSPLDVISSLKDIQWNLNVTYDPVAQSIKQYVGAMLGQLQSGNATADQIAAARSKVATMKTTNSPSAMPMMSMSDPPPSINPSVNSDGYDPTDVIKRARTLCSQINEAFSEGDAKALGCSSWKKMDTPEQAKTIINTVCDRLRVSVPTVDPAQFNCPKRSV